MTHSFGAGTVQEEQCLSAKIRWYLGGVIAVLAVANALIFMLATRRFALDGALLSATLCFNVYLAVYLLLGNQTLQNELRRRIEQWAWTSSAFLACLLIPYLIYVAGTATFSWLSLGKLLLFAAGPLIIFHRARHLPPRMTWQDLVVILWLWLPLDFRWMRDVFVWPGNALAYSFNSLLAVCLAAFLFVCLRGVADVGYRFHFTAKDWRIGLSNFLLFAPIAIPLGLGTGFIVFSTRTRELWELGAEMALASLGIFIFVAVPEELLFRGLIQNFFGRGFKRELPALIVTSVIFGAAHLNNGPRPDWRYFVLATLAGLFYGRAYLQTRKLMAPAITHTLVDVVWRVFFR
ncbi:MAG: type II CAAX endopeptidase family protein [Acidobacteriota bacterium]